GLFDWKMPGTDGAQAASRLVHAPERTQRMPVILVTAYERELAEREGAEEGSAAVLHKPISPPTLHDALLGVVTPRARRPRTAERPQPPVMPGGKRVLLVE